MYNFENIDLNIQSFTQEEIRYSNNSLNLQGAVIYANNKLQLSANQKFILVINEISKQHDYLEVNKIGSWLGHPVINIDNNIKTFEISNIKNQDLNYSFSS